MRAFKSYKSRKGSDNHDHVLDNLIQLGLIDQSKEEVTPAIQQFLRYLAIMADRLTKSHNDLVRQVGWLFREVLSRICILQDKIYKVISDIRNINNKAKSIKTKTRKYTAIPTLITIPGGPFVLERTTTQG